jgi:TolA-binding protein
LPARACVILSLLVCVRALPAANAAKPRAVSQNRTSAHAEGRISDPCAVGPTLPAGAASVEASDTTIPLAKLLNRTKSQTKALDNVSVVRRTGVPSRVNTEPNAVLSQQLWSGRIVSPDTNQDTEDSLALKRLIRQVRGVRFSNKDTGPTFTAPDESQPASGPFDAESTPATAATPAGSASVAADPSTSLPNKTQKTLDMLQRNPNQVREPLEMAELLFLSGRPAEAAPFYAKALDRVSRIDPSYDADRAWILFQLGNCLRETDTTKAQETYMKLVSEYPESPWTELAKAHGRLLTWYQKSRSGPVAASPQL